MFGQARREDEREFDLHDTLLRKEDVLVASLGGLRQALKHKGGRGDAREGEWRQVIDDFLPRRHCVAGKTEVIDHLGNTSQQQDLVIFDRHFCPLFFEEHRLTRVPAESVFAVFEVKPALDKGVIESAREKAASVRALERTNVEITDRGERKPPREPFEIVAGVLSLYSEWNPPFGEPFEKALEYDDVNHRLQLGCALQHAAFEVLYDDKAGTSEIEAASEGALMFFLLRLFARLQLIGSPMAIDLRAYSRTLEVAPEEIVAHEEDME
jgi:hypothetical protein